MSKMDGLRAMREAKFAANAARAAKPAAALRKPTPAPAETAPVTPPPASDAASSAERLCGHRAISGRTCTRELGHAAKSHRYS